MEVLKKQLEKIQQQLGGLSASQKMLTASLVAIMVMTLLYWTKYAGTAEMVEVGGPALTAEQLGPVRTKLRAEGIEFQISGDNKVLVPADKQFTAVALLGQDQLLPRDAGGGFEDVFSKLSPFSSETNNQKMFVSALQAKLEALFRRMKDVADASVFIDPTMKPGVETSIEPSASVWIHMRAGATPEKRFAE